MSSIIAASDDLAGLERYLPMFIEHAATRAESKLAARRRELRRMAAVNPDRFELERRPDIPHAFELWIGHLLELETVAGAVTLTLDDLTAEEARGLAMLRAAREQFWQEHIACPNCHTALPRTASFCGCGWSAKQ